jgi:hypothetical protein
MPVNHLDFCAALLPANGFIGSVVGGFNLSSANRTALRSFAHAEKSALAGASVCSINFG